MACRSPSTGCSEQVAQFDLYRRRGEPGYLLNVQHDVVDHLPTRLVIPVLPASDAPRAFRGINLQIEIGGVAHTVFPHYVAAFPRVELGRPVGNLASQRDALLQAFDLLLTGF